MGMMSKNSRLPERPKPPTLYEIEHDLNEAKDTDIALSIGGKYLQNMNLDLNIPLSQDSDSPTSSDASSSFVEQMDVSQDQIKESYNKVLRLLDLYSVLKDAPSDLEDKFSHLQITGAEMSESIAQLKSLSQSIGIDYDVKDSGTSTPKGKQDKTSKRHTDSKHKRKK